MVKSVISYFQTCQWTVSTAWSLRGQQLSTVEWLFALLFVEKGLRLHYDDLRYSNGNSDCYSSDDL